MKIFLLSAAGVAVFGSSPAYSALLLTDFTITTTAVSFDITGTIDNSATIGPTGQFQLYLGVPGDTDWITSNTFSPTVANNGGFVYSKNRSPHISMGCWRFCECLRYFCWHLYSGKS